MTTIVVLSDTHMPAQASSLPEPVVKALQSADYCIHAGDFVNPAVVDTIRKLAKNFVGVKGNMDGSDIKLPRKSIVTIEGVTIGTIHGEGSPSHLFEFVKDSFAENKNVDLVIYGHSHRANKEAIGKVTYFNPGSATDTMYADKNTYGIIKVDNGRIVSVQVKNI